MKTEYTNQENILKEVATVRRTWWPSSQGVRDSLVIAGAVATVVGVLWGIGFSMISGLENRLIDRIDGVESALSDRIDGVEGALSDRIDGVEGALSDRIDSVEGALSDRIDSVEGGRDGRIDSLERAMVEGFKQTHQRMDRIEERIDGRMDRIESDIDAIESDIDAIEKHLIRIGSAIENEGSPAVITPAVAAPGPLVSSTSEIRTESTSTIPSSGER